MKITYTFANGEKSEIEVTEDWGAIVLDMDRLDYNSNQRETRRHCSLEAFNLDDAYFPSDEDVESDVIRNERDAALYSAVEQLLPEQQRLIRAVHFEGVPAVEIAKHEGVSKSAISHRLSRAENALRKILG